MNTRWHKVRGDFRAHRVQIALIAVVLALGAAAVVAALNTHAVLKREIARSYARSNSPDIVLWFEAVPRGVVEAMRAWPGIADADARRIISTKVAGKKPGEWLPMRIVIVPDLADQHVGVVHQHDATWPAGDAGMLVEQSSLALLAEGARTLLHLRAPGGGDVSLPISGVVHDTAVAPGVMERFVYAFATPAIASKLGQSADLDQVALIMEDRATGPTTTADALNAWLTAHGTPSLRTEVLPNVHPHAGLMSALLQVLLGLAVLAFTCSAALAAFVVSLWMKREVRQVGIMKTIGARPHQIAFQYLALVGPVVVVATGIGLFAGRQLGRWLIAYCAAEQNIDISRWEIPGTLALAEILCATGIPFLAMAIPIVSAARISAREAIHDSGISVPATSTWVSRWIATGDRRWTFAFRNSFRRKWRLAVTLLGLGAGGAVLLTSNNLYASLMSVIDTSIADRGHDLQFAVTRPLPVAELEALARNIPGIEIAEAWPRATVEIFPPSATTGPRAPLSAFPIDTRLAKLPIKAGHWPTPTETGAVVITKPLQARLPALQVGAEFTLKYRERRTAVHIAGVVEEIASPVLYGDAALFALVTGVNDRASELRVKVRDERDVKSVVAALDDAILAARVPASPIVTRANLREVYDEHFSNFVVVCGVIALAAALIGAICLVAFASLNVIERAREIGVIRTVGAAPPQVLRLFLAESAAIAVLGGALAVAIALPASMLINRLIANNALLIPIPLVFSWKALGVLGGSLPVALLGVGFAVSRLLRVSVREVLAYE